MIDHIISAQDANLAYARLLVQDLSPPQMVAQPVPGLVLNHAAWTLGHLVIATEFALSFMGGKASETPAAWSPLFAPGSKPESDASKYPAKAELLAALEGAFTRRTHAARNMPAGRWDEPFAIEKFRPVWPTLGDATVSMMTNHDATHLGQLSSWRRALGLPPVR